MDLVGALNPPEKIWKSIGMIILNIWKNSSHVPITTNQISMPSPFSGSCGCPSCWPHPLCTYQEKVGGVGGAGGAVEHGTTKRVAMASLTSATYISHHLFRYLDMCRVVIWYPKISMARFPGPWSTSSTLQQLWPGECWDWSLDTERTLPDSKTFPVDPSGTFVRNSHQIFQGTCLPNILAPPGLGARLQFERQNEGLAKSGEEGWSRAKQSEVGWSEVKICRTLGPANLEQWITFFERSPPRNTILTLMRKCLWHIHSGILSDILSGIYIKMLSDIQLTFYLAFLPTFWHCSDILIYLMAILLTLFSSSILSGIHSDVLLALHLEFSLACTPQHPQLARKRKWEEEGEEGNEGVVTLSKSRDPHLAGWGKPNRRK